MPTDTTLPSLGYEPSLGHIKGGERLVSQSRHYDVTDCARIVIEACLFLTLLRGRWRLVGVVNSPVKTRLPWQWQLHNF